MNAVIELNGSTVIFTDDQGNVLDRYAVRRISIIGKNTKGILATSGGTSGDISNNNDGGSANEKDLRLIVEKV